MSLAESLRAARKLGGLGEKKNQIFFSPKHCNFRAGPTITRKQRQTRFWIVSETGKILKIRHGICCPRRVSRPSGGLGGLERKGRTDLIFSKTLQVPDGDRNHTKTKTEAFLDRLRNRENPQKSSQSVRKSGTSRFLQTGKIFSRRRRYLKPPFATTPSCQQKRNGHTPAPPPHP